MSPASGTSSCCLKLIWRTNFVCTQLHDELWQIAWPSHDLSKSWKGGGGVMLTAVSKSPALLITSVLICYHSTYSKSLQLRLRQFNSYGWLPGNGTCTLAVLTRAIGIGVLFLITNIRNPGGWRADLLDTLWGSGSTASWLEGATMTWKVNIWIGPAPSLELCLFKSSPCSSTPHLEELRN